MVKSRRSTGIGAKQTACAELGQNLRTLRRKRGMTQDDLAKGIGVSVHSVRGWEAGRHEPAETNIAKLNVLFGADPIGSGDATPKGGSERPFAVTELRVDGAALRRARQMANMSQATAARETGLNKGSISRYEHGKVMPSDDALTALARVYGTKPETFVFHEQRQAADASGDNRDNNLADQPR